MTENPRIRLYANKIGNRITFRSKTGCYLELLTHKTMKLLESTKSKITKDENGKSAASFRNYRSSISPLQYYTFVPNKSFGQLLDISPKNFMILKTFDSDIEVWFTDQNSKLLEIK